MAANLNQLAKRTLQKLQVLAANENAAPEDLEKAIEKVKAAQYLLEAEGLVRWTLNDVANYAEEPLVMIAAYLGASDFDQKADPAWMSQAVTMVQRATHLGSTSTVRTEYF